MSLPDCSLRGKLFDLGALRKNYLIHYQISCSRTRYIMFQNKLLFKVVNDLFKRNDGLGRSVTVQVQTERNNFGPRLNAKKYSIRCQTSRSKTRHIVFQHKLLFNLFKDLFKRIEGLGRSVTVQVVLEWKNSEPRMNVEKVHDTLSNFALKISPYSVST